MSQDQPQHLNHNGFQLEYVKHGKGSHTLISLHGFGRDYFDFKFFNPMLEKHFTVIGINLFFHGKSKFPQDRELRQPITKKEWHQLFGVLLEKEKVSRFSLLAFSMGGKFALTSLEKHAHITDSALLLAPDGIVINPWYKLVTGTVLGKKITKAFIKNRLAIPQTLSAAQKVGLLNPNFKKFVDYNTDTEKKRRLIYQVWQGFKEIHPNLHHVASEVKKHNVHLHVVLGKRDVAIKAHYQKKVRLLFGENADVTLLNLGHNLFKEPTRKVFESWAKKSPLTNS